ncbi:MAG: hypothetical protein ACQESK_09960 [Bacteroidota bacterium]
MEKKKFLSLIILDEYYNQDREFNFNKLFEDLLKSGFYTEKNINDAQKLKALNGCWNGDNLEKKSAYFASIIRNNKCYFLSDEYLDEVVNALFNKAKAEAILQKKQLISLHLGKEEGFIYKKDLLSYYETVLKSLVNTKIGLKKTYMVLNIDLSKPKFDSRISNIIKEKLQCSADFNYHYVATFKKGAIKNDYSLRNQFNHLKQLFFIEDIIIFVKERIEIFKDGLEKEEQNKNKPTFKKEYLSYFNSEFGFKVLVEFAERFKTENITPAVAVKLNELFNEAYSIYNVSRMCKKISKKGFSELLNEILNTNLSDLRSVDPTKDTNIDKIFKESIKCIKSTT